MSSILVNNYLGYLRDVSRRIVRKADFRNVLPKETKNSRGYFYDLERQIDFSLPKLLRGETLTLKQGRLYDYLQSISTYLQNQPDKRLFIGFGLVAGNDSKSGKSQNLAAPLFYCLAELEQKDNKAFDLSLDADSFQLNLDFLATRIDGKAFRIDDEDDYALSIEDQERLERIDDLAKDLKLENFDRTETLTTLFERLNQSDAGLMRGIVCVSDHFDYSRRFDPAKGLQFRPIPFLFVHKVPGELSTYQALQGLMEQQPIEHPLLESLLHHRLTGKPFDNSPPDHVPSEDIKQALKNNPLELSLAQKQALTVIWEHGITYIEGPPGTGKSHTITALMCMALELGKSVLFVSHKTAAIEVVKDKIDKLLGPTILLYCTEKKRLETIEYFKQILTESQSYGKETANLRLAESADMASAKNVAVEKSLTQLFNYERQIDALIELEQMHTSYFDSFIQCRDNLKKLGLQDDLRNIEFAKKFANRATIQKGASRLHQYLEQRDKQRVAKPMERLFLVKFLKANEKLLGLKAKKAITQPELLDKFIELHSTSADAHQTLKQINWQRLQTLRLLRKQLIEELKQKLIHRLQAKLDLLRAKAMHPDSKRERLALDERRKSIFSRQAKNIKEFWSRIDFDLLHQSFPLWCANLTELNGAFPLKSQMFDLVVVDEASQVNLAEIIPALYRGKRFVIVGDNKQLHLNATGVGFSLTRSYDQLCWQQNHLHETISITEAKAQHLIVSEASVLRFLQAEESAGSIPRKALNEHFRSLPGLAAYNNRTFYEKGWKVMTENAQNQQVMPFKAIWVEGERDVLSGSKFVQAEVESAIWLVKRLLDPNVRLNGQMPELAEIHGLPKTPSIGILSILRDTVSEISARLDELLSEEQWEKHNLMIGTPEEFQGNERDIMILTMGLGTNQSSLAKWHYENPNRWNVATSRAKFFTYFISGGLPKNADRILKYLLHFGVQVPSHFLRDSNAITEEMAPKEPLWSWSYKAEKLESEFERAVADVLHAYYLGTRPSVKLYNQVTACGQKRLDFVLFNELAKRTVALEVDGRAHFMEHDGRKYTEAHMDRVETLQRAGWRIVHTAYHEWYRDGWLLQRDDRFFRKMLSNLFDQLDDALELPRRPLLWED